MSEGQPITVLHFVAATQDRGGILTVVRAFSEIVTGIPPVAENPPSPSPKFRTVRAVTWVARDFEQERFPRLRLLRRKTLPAETITARTLWLAAGEACRLRFSLRGKRRIFHGHSRAGLLVGLWLQLLGSDRVVITVHNHGRQRWFYRFAAVVLGDRLVWLTPAMKRHYDVGAGSWRGCQPNFLPASAIKPRLALTGDRLRLAGIGSLVEWKNWALVLEALARLTPAEKTCVEFQHLGSSDGSDESQLHAQNLRARARELGLSQQIVWRGEEPSSVNLLATVDVLVLPAATEPFGLGVLEAWRAGVPVLVARGSGAAELVQGDSGGWTFAANSPDALAQKISWLLRTRADRKLRPTLPPTEPIVTAWISRYSEIVNGPTNLV